MVPAHVDVRVTRSDNIGIRFNEWRLQRLPGIDDIDIQPVEISYIPCRNREAALTKLLKKLSKSNNSKDLLNNYGYKKYLHVKGETELGIDPDKVNEAQRWDRLHGVITNLPDTMNPN